MGYNEEISPLRERINAIDAQLIGLFEDRMGAAAGIASVKEKHGKAVFDGQREELVIDRALSQLKNKDLGDDTRSFLRALMDISKRRQHKAMPTPPAKSLMPDSNTAIGYLGLPGSFSHIAASQAFGDTGALRNYPTFEAIFEAMKTGDISYAIVPSENTETGSVTAVVDLLAKYGYYIVAEKLLGIRNSLLGIPGATIDDIKKVYSHPQPLAQCRTFLTEHPNMQTYPSLSTAQAAQYISDLGDKSVGCIASTQAAAIYNLDVIRPDIQNNDNNVTRFVIIAKNPRSDAECNKTSIVFMVAHQPGSLCKILKTFSDGGVNILKLESRPMKDRPFEYMFHLDFEGSTSDAHVAKTIEKARKDLTGYIYLGSYPREKMAF